MSRKEESSEERQQQKRIRKKGHKEGFGEWEEKITNRRNQEWGEEWELKKDRNKEVGCVGVEDWQEERVVGRGTRKTKFFFTPNQIVCGLG